jgi:hypothetical protein
MEPTLRNPARERLEAGELALGVSIRQSRTVDIASIMKGFTDDGTVRVHWIASSESIAELVDFFYAAIAYIRYNPCLACGSKK